MRKTNKFFNVKNLSAILRDVTTGDSISLILHDNVHHNDAMRNLTARMVKLGMKASTNKFQVVINGEIVTGILLNVKKGVNDE